MKKEKLNNCGFVLIETLIVTVFVMTIFAVLYNNFTPIMGEYEKREFYDDIDGKYAAYWFKMLIEKDDYSISGVNTAPYYSAFDCTDLINGTSENLCNVLKTRLMVSHIYITQYNLSDFKNYLQNVDVLSGGMHRYIGHLPDFKYDSLNGAKYRIIIEFERGYDKDKDGALNEDEDGNGIVEEGEKSYMAYSTFEVIK